MAMRDTIAERTTGPYLATVLKLMAFNFNRSADLRRELYQRCNGLSRPFDSRFQFRTIDNAINLYLTIEGGRMRGGSGGVREPHVVATFRDAAAMRTFLSPFARSDPLNLMIDNKLSFEGNLSHLGRLGHLTAVARNRGWRKKLGAAPEAGDSAQAGDSMLAASRAERRRGGARAPGGRGGAPRRPVPLSLLPRRLPRFRRCAPSSSAPRRICTERPRLITEFCREHGFETDPEGSECDPSCGRPARSTTSFRTRSRSSATSPPRRDDHHEVPRRGHLPRARRDGASGPSCSRSSARALNPYRIADEDVAVLNDEVFPFWIDRNVREWARHTERAPLPAARRALRALLHVEDPRRLAHHPRLAARAAARPGRHPGRRGARRGAPPTSGAALLPGVADRLRGVLELRRAGSRDRRARRSRRGATAATHGARAELLEMARVCASAGAPRRTLHEALQAIWLVRLCLHQESMNAGLSVGRLDLWLQPFLARPRRCRTTEERRGRVQARARAGRRLHDEAHRPPADRPRHRQPPVRRQSSSDQAITLGGVDAGRQERGLRHDLHLPQGHRDAAAARPQHERALPPGEELARPT